MRISYDDLMAHVGKTVEVSVIGVRLTMAGTLSIVKHPKLKVQHMKVSTVSDSGYATVEIRPSMSLHIDLDEAGNDGEIGWPERIRIVIE